MRGVSCDGEGRLGHWIFASISVYAWQAAVMRMGKPWGREMSTFDKREETFEKTFVHEEELQFRAEARRNKLLGLWAAEKLGKTPEQSRIYANELVSAETAANASQIVLERVLKDFQAAGVDQSEHQVRRRMDELLATATAEIKDGK
jgi:hypothetical protein